MKFKELLMESKSEDLKFKNKVKEWGSVRDDTYTKLTLKTFDDLRKIKDVKLQKKIDKWLKQGSTMLLIDILKTLPKDYFKRNLEYDNVFGSMDTIGIYHRKNKKVEK